MTTVTPRGAATALLGLVLAFFVAVFVVQAAPGVIGAEESYVVLSGSMEPEISPGDAVIVKSVDPASVEAGDVITYKRTSDAKPVTHRVVEVTQQNGERVFRTQGDANEDPDPTPVPADALVGEVWFTIPLVGHVVLFANTVLGRVVLVGLPLLALAVSELYNFLTESEEASSDDASSDAPDGDSADEPGVSADARADDSGAGTVAASPDESDSGGVTLTAYDLRLSSAAFGLLAVYSGYVAYGDPSPVKVAIFAGAAMVVLFLVGVLLFTEGPSPPARASRADGGELVDADADDGDADADDAADADAENSVEDGEGASPRDAPDEGDAASADDVDEAGGAADETGGEDGDS